MSETPVGTRPAFFSTHEVTNQPPPLVDHNPFLLDQALGEATLREGAKNHQDELARFGQRLGTSPVQEWGALANRHTPALNAFDRYGHRRDYVEFHPAWHNLMALGIAEGVHSAPWTDPHPGHHVARAAKVMLLVQVEAGVQCPITMTYGAIPALRNEEWLPPEWMDRLSTRQYDPSFRPIQEKRGALIGMGMTEKQGGSDVRANSTGARPLDGKGGPGKPYRIIGHKWFFSAPMCDAFLILAQTQSGLSCFFLPRWLDDGRLNAIQIQRLKDKVGNRSNASSEVEFHGAIGYLMGEEGRGVPAILEMGNYTRLDCALGTAGLMRAALAQAMHHATHRMAFGRRLMDQPVMMNVLSDLALESEATTQLVMRLAGAWDRQQDEGESLFRRLVTPAVKYYVCKRGPAFGAEAMEVMGGNGYVEEATLGRIYREMPLNSIWEGSGNIMTIDMLRALAKQTQAFDAVYSELDAARGGNRLLDAQLINLRSKLIEDLMSESQARRFAERLIRNLQAALMVRYAPSAVADAFCASRLSGDWGPNYGSLPNGADFKAIITRAWPEAYT